MSARVRTKRDQRKADRGVASVTGRAPSRYHSWGTSGSTRICVPAGMWSTIQSRVAVRVSSRVSTMSLWIA